MDPQTLLECCAKACNQEHELDEGVYDTVGVSPLRTLEHRSMILKELDALRKAVKDRNWGKVSFGNGRCVVPCL